MPATRENYRHNARSTQQQSVPAIQTVLDAGYVDAFRVLHPNDPGLTLPTKNPQVRLDYVFVPQPHASRVLACDVVRDPVAVGASDHFPVMADLRIGE